MASDVAERHVPGTLRARSPAQALRNATAPGRPGCLPAGRLTHWDPASRFSIPPQKSAAAAAAGRVLAPKHKFVLWGALLNRRSRQQKILVGLQVTTVYGDLCPVEL